MKQTIIYVTGMHCSACELLIEKKLLTLKAIEGVDVSVSDGRVLIHSHKKMPYSIDELNALVVDLGYTFHHQKPVTKKLEASPILYFVEGEQGIKFDRKEFVRRYEWLLILFVIIIGWQIIGGLEVGRFMNTGEQTTLAGMLLLGLVASVSSCAALIGGLLLSLTKQWYEQTILDSKTTKIIPHMQFHIGRLVGFILGGGVLGLLGNVVTLDNIRVYSVLVLLVSIFMVIVALQMLEISWAQKLRFRLPKGITMPLLSNTKRGSWLIGAGTFFLPCGFTLIAQAVALASGSFWLGGITMGMFALGTMPVLLGISVGGLKMNSKPKLTARFNLYAGILVLLFALYNINGQLNLLGLPSVSDLRAKPSQKSMVETSLNGEQIIRVTADRFRYTPTTSMTIQAGVPTKLIVDDKGIQGCGVYLAVSGLMDGFVALKLGENIIDLGKPRAGNYKITCSMGMVPPVTLRVL